MKHGDYVLIKDSDETWKGRVSIENGDTYICQNYHNAHTATEQFGHEFALNLGHGRPLKVRLNAYSIKKVTKAVYDAHKDPIEKKVFGYNVYKRKGGIVEFGCGAVTLNVKEIRDFINNRDEYVNLIKKRNKQINKLSEEVRNERDKVNNWLNNHAGTKAVVEALRGRYLKPENANIDKLKQLFGPSERKKS